MEVPEAMTLVKLSCQGNTVEFTEAVVTACIRSLAMLVQIPAGDPRTQKFGPAGPYSVAMSRELAEYLAADGEVDVIEPSSDGEAVTFRVSLLDQQGRAADPEALDRVRAVRADRARTRDGEKRERTHRFFLQGNLEMLAQPAGSPRLRELQANAKKEFMKSLGPYESINWDEPKDEVGDVRNELMAFVVLQKEDYPSEGTFRDKRPP